MEKYIYGDELNLFVGGTCLAHATNHGLHISTSTIDVASKDYGFWGATDIGKVTWEVTTDNLFTYKDFKTLMQYAINKTEVTLVFGKPSNFDENGLNETNLTAWTAPSTDGFTGKAVITDLNLTSQSGDKATFTATFTGRGALTAQAASAQETATEVEPE